MVTNDEIKKDKKLRECLIKARMLIIRLGLRADPYPLDYDECSHEKWSICIDPYDGVKCLSGCGVHRGGL